jgi:hypothetical protein
MTRHEEAVGVVPTIETWPWGRPQESCVEVIVLRPVEKARVERLILLNAPVLPRRPMVVVSAPASIEGVRALVKAAKSVESYIGHEATARLLSELLSINIPVNRAEYSPSAGDTAVVVRLKRRLPSPQDLKSVALDDLEFYVVSYLSLNVEVWR